MPPRAMEVTNVGGPVKALAMGEPTACLKERGAIDSSPLLPRRNVDSRLAHFVVLKKKKRGQLSRFICKISIFKCGST